MPSSWELPLEGSSDSARVEFFVRIIPNGDILRVEAFIDDSVNNTVNRITTKKEIPVTEHRLVYGGRQLQTDQCLGDYSIEQNALVYLVGTQYSNWPAVDSFFETVVNVYRGQIGHSEISEKLDMFFDVIPWHSEDAAVEYLQNFSASSVPSALVMLYSSPIENDEVFAKHSIRKFLTKCRDLPCTAHKQIIPMIYELCRMLKKVRPDKKLHWSCWTVFTSMLDWVDTFPCEGMRLFVKRATISFLMEIAFVLHSNIAADMSYDAIFKELVIAIGSSLNEDESAFCPEYLFSLKAINALSSSIREFAKDELMSVLKSRKAALCTLITRFANRGDDHQWLNELKDLTNFEARRHLAMLMLPILGHGLMRKDIKIPRSNLLVESSLQIMAASPESLQHGISVEFDLEPGIGDGVTREFLLLLSEEIFRCDVKPPPPFYVPYTEHARRFSPNPGFMVNTMFEFAGRVMGVALMHEIQLNVFFDRIFFLQLAGMEIGLEDIKETEPILYKSLNDMLEDPTKIGDGLTFEIDVKRGDNVFSEELCQAGNSIVVTRENVNEYTDLYVRHKFVKSISEQVSFFAKGFSDMLLGSTPHTSFFRSLLPEDFDLMFGGDVTGIIMEEWKAHTTYDSGFEATDREIGWFWNIVEGMTEPSQRNLLRFWASIEFLPHGGFRGLPKKFKILKAADSEYPSSNTCFYILHLPAYETFEEMKTVLENICGDDYYYIGFGQA
ncbi:unnamed protein product [Arabidopsis lyrata]|uniref:E3 ubiquitin-protein ligase UPL5-like n=1 Tax=Arabidopsis lyrata subsp. lyrata TaxID=81972 RepID=UPI000A29E4A3|nr:E3 ubiquitin-protein ligase UPL5-like [Arabidopsis lyrata subsp. lyrata]CAH8270511.1 unnamed protein product [Arabidopsis lyrata]|eukprot:XP_020878154.1 E3 ubiquitin-protein ligase UPL5-like [Arabidopsis lyrata subsp. lyrata]